MAETQNTPMGCNDFPFEDRDESFRSQLDDIAKRHPEFAQHLKFPFDSKRRGSDGSHRFRESPFRNRFEDPFGGFDEGRRPRASSRVENPERPPQPPQARKPASGGHDQKSSDQPQDSEEDRGQRSMSAPPDNRNSQQRFTSSVNIPMNMDPNQQQERVIPILVEGRDIPVTPKSPPNHQQAPPQQPPPQQHEPPPPQPQPQQAQQNWHQPQSERIFSGSPRFGHNWNRSDFFPDTSQFFQGEPAEYFQTPSYFINRDQQNRARQQQQQQPPPQQPFQKAKAPQQQQVPPPPQQQQQPPPPPPAAQQQQQQPPQQQPPPPQKPTGPLTPLEQIQWIQKEIQSLMGEIEKFNGKPKDKQYLYLDEMLTRNLLKLDNVETEGKENIRQARRDAIKCIQKCISILETKAKANELLYSDKMDVDVIKALSQGGESAAEPSEQMETEQPQLEPQSEVPVDEVKNEENPPVENAAAVDNPPDQQPPQEEVQENTLDENVEVPAVEKASEDNKTEEPVKEKPKDKKDTKKVKKKATEKL